ncbi:MAG: hypothetical protein A2Z97_06160 [Bdellovibrionales bacterium GWB1_52_6]|nr:MAG: hypothetical protein A2Z97_06160 [Bdellovibrionales bacterium GWB1_52_6]OFZ06087.1 MAG: hypothetical protein A2X97_02000 [Bdellovibrionales bacterium GWA1_52_35]HCM39286.1 hypothetical protein [Bdellovibrionales bacterium]
MKKFQKKPAKGARKTFRFLWITDPWHFLAHAGDTTLRLAEEAELLGHESYWADVRSLRFDGKVTIQAQRLRYPVKGGVPERLAENTYVPRDFNSIHWRMDPVVDATYLHPLMLLTLGLREPGKNKRKTEIVNPPELLHGMNEKLEPFGFSAAPPSIVSSQWEVLSRFGQKEGQAVIKPLDLCQSKGIALLSWKSPEDVEEAHQYIEQITENFRRPVLLQRYLPEIKNGELRVWFLDGKVLATARKFPVKGDFRVNIDRGSRIEKATLSASERSSLRSISLHLKKLNIRLAAVDLIGSYVTDFNFTSPGLLRDLERLNGKNLARPIIEALASARKKP